MTNDGPTTEVDPRLQDIQFEQVRQGLERMLADSSIISRVSYVNEHDKPTALTGSLRSMDSNLCIFELSDRTTRPVNALKITWITEQLGVSKPQK